MGLTGFDKALEEAVAAITATGSLFEAGPVQVLGKLMTGFPRAPATLRDFCQLFMTANGDREFLVYGDERYHFADVAAQARKTGAMLQQRFAVAKGDRVAIAMRNYPEWISAFLGAAWIGAVVVPMNAWLKAEELHYALAHCGARVVFADDERVARLKERPAPGVAVIGVRLKGDEPAVTRLESALAAAPDEPFYLPPLAPDDDACIMYTSGSTGVPKGAVSTQRAIVSATLSYVVQGLATLQVARNAGRSVSDRQSMLLNLPLFHITGLVPVMLMSIAIGRKLVILYRWDAGEALRLIAKERLTYFIGVPTMSLELAQQAAQSGADLSSLENIAAGGAAQSAGQLQQLLKAFPGKAAMVGYGLTETNGAGAGNMGESYQKRPDSVGRPSKPLIEIAVFDAAQTRLLGGETGEICVRSAVNARGYWNDPQTTAENFTGDGWFRTGDLGRLDDDGFLYIVDRKKDIIIRGGENVSAAEVEAAIYRQPGVAEVAVIGLPDARLGEVVGAVVFGKPGVALAAADVTAFVAQELASFKVPHQVWIVDQPLPKLASGKIDKMAIRARYGVAASQRP